MENALTPATEWLSGHYRILVARYGVNLSTPSGQKTALIAALIAAAVIAAVLVATIIRLPAKRKVVRKRRVRRTRREISKQPLLVASADAAATEDAPKKTARLRRGAGIAVSTVIWVVLVPAVFVGTYVLTGTNKYCGQSCHGKDKHVVAAVNIHHADCIDCHESGPVFGVVSRVRMALAQGSKGTAASAATAADAIPVDPDRCLRCHRDLASTVVRTKTGLIVSHKEILAGGRTCSDCHSDVGHLKGFDISGGMSRCTSCHDGVVAARTCETCHVGGSPISVAGAATKASSAFDYGPAIRVTSTDCSRCHGAETECKACHNGLVLPHPAQFIQGGHARIAAFQGKQICYKCHSLAWCSSGGCHNTFAHNQKTWPVEHQKGTSAQCGSCHVSWNGQGDFCKVCH